MLEIVATIPMKDTLNSNDTKGKHWGSSSPKVARLREKGGWLLREKRTGNHLLFERCHINAYLAFPDRIRRDDMNFYLTSKAIVDGFIDARLAEDDNGKHVVGPHHWPADKLSGIRGVLVIKYVITELPPAPVF